MAAKGAQKKQKKHTLADLADRHHLYELSVQNAESEIDFVSSTFRKLRKRPARLLREDFCGTANVCCEWVSRHRDNMAIGVDLDREVLDWGRANRLSRLKKSAAQRVRLIEADVLKARTEPVDIVSAMNFSYWLLTDRKRLGRYFKAAYRALKDDGVMFLDAYGGYDAFREIEEPREIDEDDWQFTYTWEQAKFDPITNQLWCHIHFDFPDGSSLPQAFSYHWRLWTLPEVTELLQGAGFKRITHYWQGWDEDGEADGNFKPVRAGEPDADAGWISYISAEK